MNTHEETLKDAEKKELKYVRRKAVEWVEE